MCLKRSLYTSYYAHSYSRVKRCYRTLVEKSTCKEFPYKLTVGGYFLAIKLCRNITVDWIALKKKGKRGVERKESELLTFSLFFLSLSRIARGWQEFIDESRLRLARKWKRSKKFLGRRASIDDESRERSGVSYERRRC